MDSLLTDLGEGQYGVSLTDANGCSAGFVFPPLQAPDTLQQAGAVKDASTPSAQDGAIDIISAAGGTPPYAYLWNTGQQSEPLAGLSPGTYTLTLTDKRGCTSVWSYTVGVVNAVEVPGVGGILAFYPNPAGEYVMAEWPQTLRAATLELFDSAGRLQRKFTLQSNPERLDLNGLAGGTYEAILRGEHGETLANGVILR